MNQIFLGKGRVGSRNKKDSQYWIAARQTHVEEELQEELLVELSYTIVHPWAWKNLDILCYSSVTDSHLRAIINSFKRDTFWHHLKKMMWPTLWLSCPNIAFRSPLFIYYLYYDSTHCKIDVINCQDRRSKNLSAVKLSVFLDSTL